MRPFSLFFIALSLLFSAQAFAAPFAYVTNFAGNDVSVIDISNQAGGDSVVAKINVGNGPHSIVLNPVTARAYVTNSYDNNLSVINTANNSELSTVPVGKEPRGLAVNAQGSRVYVANSAGDSVSVIDTAKNTVIDTLDVQSPTAIAVNHAGTKAYVTNSFANTVSVIDTATHTITDTINVGKNPQGIALNPTGAKAFVANKDSNSVSVIDTATNTVSYTVKVGTAPFGIALSLEGTKAYVSNQESVSVLDTASNKVIATALQGRQLQLQGIAINSSGTEAYVATHNQNQVSVIDLTTNTYKTAIEVGNSPLGMAVTPINPDLAVKSSPNKLSRAAGTGSDSHTPALVTAAAKETISCVFTFFETNYSQYYAPTNTTLIPYGNSTYRYYYSTDSLLVYNPANDTIYGGYGYYGNGFYYGYYYLYAGTLSYWKEIAACGAPAPVQCTAPQVRDPSTNTCITPAVTCTAPQVRDASTNTCVTPAVTCTTPQVRDASTNTCVTPQVQCTAPQVLQNNVCVTPASNETYKIGDKGPSGGIVFYVYDSGKHGLEAQPADYFKRPTTTALNPLRLHWQDAMSAANSYGSGWRLATKDEWNQLYEQKSVVGGFGNYYYWSSTESSSSSAWVQSFLSGRPDTSNKDNYHIVRAVRAF